VDGFDKPVQHGRLTGGRTPADAPVPQAMHLDPPGPDRGDCLQNSEEEGRVSIQPFAPGAGMGCSIASLRAGSVRTITTCSLCHGTTKQEVPDRDDGERRRVVPGGYSSEQRVGGLGRRLKVSFPRTGTRRGNQFVWDASKRDRSEVRQSATCVAGATFELGGPVQRSLDLSAKEDTRKAVKRAKECGPRHGTMERCGITF